MFDKKSNATVEEITALIQSHDLSPADLSKLALAIKDFLQKRHPKLVEEDDSAPLSGAQIVEADDDEYS